MNKVRFHDKIRAEGDGRIGFWASDDQTSGCDISIPLAAIDDEPFTDKKDTTETTLWIDGARFAEIEFEDSDELDGKTVSIEPPDADDWARHGSHYICCCHNPITLRRIHFRVIDRDYMLIRVSMTIHYNVHGLGDDLNLDLESRVYVEGDAE
jgi:hypothetical protein